MVVKLCDLVSNFLEPSVDGIKTFVDIFVGAVVDVFGVMKQLVATNPGPGPNASGETDLEDNHHEVRDGPPPSYNVSSVLLSVVPPVLKPHTFLDSFRNRSTDSLPSASP